MMAYHPLLNALVAPAQQIGHQRPAGVGMPHALPQQIRFGSVAPGLAQNSPFSGGRVAAPGSPLQPTPAETFSPHAQASGPAASTLAPFMQTPQGGAPTPMTPGSSTGGFTGATALPPEPGRTPTTPSALNTALNPNIQAARAYIANAAGSPTPSDLNTFRGTISRAAGSPTSSALATFISQLAQQGQKANLSSGAGTIRY